MITLDEKIEYLGSRFISLNRGFYENNIVWFVEFYLMGKPFVTSTYNTANEALDSAITTVKELSN